MRLINADIYREKLIDEQWNLEDVDGESHIRIDEVGHCINMLDRETIIEAIPIEWIEDWFLTKMKWKEHILMDKWFTGEDAIRFDVQGMFNAMVVDWRDENADS